jgi:hypothetical protein
MDWFVTQVIFHKFKSPPHQKYFNLLWSYHSMILRKHTHLNTFDISASDSKETALEMEKLSEYIMWLALQCTTKWHQNICITGHYLQSPRTSDWTWCAHINIIIVNIGTESSVRFLWNPTQLLPGLKDTLWILTRSKRSETKHIIIYTDITQDLETPSVAYN